jgi:hypothetical protein
LIILGALCGGGSALFTRQSAEAALIAQSLSEQFALSQQDIEAGRYAVARQRLEYILGQDSEYPGAQELLAEVIVKAQITPTPSLTPTPTTTPTPDFTEADGLFVQVQQALAEGNWDAALAALDELRVLAPTYRAAVADGMYYIALRNRGVDKLLNQHLLEGGIYDLGLAERFGPLDGQAAGFRNFSEMYIRGASYWDLDWEQAVYYFSQVAPYLPYLSDASGTTAAERYRLAMIGWGSQLFSREEWCRAEEVLDQALQLGEDEQARALLEEATERCHPPAPPTESPTPTKTGEPSSPPTEEPPAETPTPTP